MALPSIGCSEWAWCEADCFPNSAGWHRAQTSDPTNSAGRHLVTDTTDNAASRGRKQRRLIFPSVHNIDAGIFSSLNLPHLVELHLRFGFAAHAAIHRR